MTSRAAWAALFLDAIPGCASWSGGVVACVAWMESERSWQIAARGALANPLDTEERWFGSWNFNSAGVQNYPDQATGIAASVATITNGDYPELLAALRSQASSSVVCAAKSSG